MTTVHPLPASDEPALATVTSLAVTSSERGAWLATCEHAWDLRAAGSGRWEDHLQHRRQDRRQGRADDGGADRERVLGQVRRVRAEADRHGDDFVVAVCDVVLLDASAAGSFLGDALAGLVPAASDLETYPPSPWAGRAHGALGRVFERLGETDLAQEHFRRQQEVGEVLEDLELQADALARIGALLPAGIDRLDTFAAAEAMYTRASVEHQGAVVGGLLARLGRARTNVALGLLAAATEQLPYVLDMAASAGLTTIEASARALHARCLALGGAAQAALDTVHAALERARDLPAAARLDIGLECARALLAGGRPDLVVALLDTDEVRTDTDLVRREQALTVLAGAHETLGSSREAFETLLVADRAGQARVEAESAARVAAMRGYHRTRSAERDLAERRDLSARFLPDVPTPGERDGISDVAVRDAVTGLPNRRHLDLELRWRSSQRLPGRGVMSLAVLRLDHVEDLEAELGTDDLDRLLVLAAQLLRSRVRGGDAVARLERCGFAVIQFHRDTEAARLAGERLREAVASFPWREHRLGRDVTVSVGIAALTPPATPGAFLGRACAAAGQAGAEGGDRVRLSGD